MVEVDSTVGESIETRGRTGYTGRGMGQKWRGQRGGQSQNARRVGGGSVRQSNESNGRFQDGVAED